MSLALAGLLWLDYPIFALIAAVIVTDLSPAPAQWRQLGFQRPAAKMC